MYYIDRPATWKAANKKWEKVQEYAVGAYSNAMIQSEETKAAVVDDIRNIVAILNSEHERTKPLVVDYHDNYIRCYPEGNLNSLIGDKYVFTLQFRPVDKMFSTKTRDGRLEAMVYNKTPDSYTPDLRWMMMRGGEELKTTQWKPCSIIEINKFQKVHVMENYMSLVTPIVVQVSNDANTAKNAPYTRRTKRKLTITT